MTDPTREPSEQEVEAGADAVRWLADEAIDPKEVARDVLTAAAQVREGADGWQPIETAPKDGTTILGGWINGEAHTGSISEGKWVPAWDTDKPWAMPSWWQPVADVPLPIYGATEPDSGPSVLGLRKGEEP